MFKRDQAFVAALFGLCLVACGDVTSSADKPAPGARADRPDGAGDPSSNRPDRAQLPEAEKLLEAHVAAAGGRERIPLSLSMTAKLTVEAQKLTEDVSLWWEQGRFYLEGVTEGVGITRAGYDGNVAWSDDPIYRLRKREGPESEQLIRGAAVFVVAVWKDHFLSAQTKAKRELDGRTVYDVELVSPMGATVTMTFDDTTKLLVATQSELITPAGPVPSKTKVSDYRSVGGYKLAHRLTTVTPVLTLEQQQTEYKAGVAIDTSRFKMPTELEIVPAKPQEQARAPGPKGG